MDWEIKDDLGNVYEYEVNGGHGKVGDEMIEMDGKGNETHFNYEGLPEGVNAGEWTMKEISVDISAVN